MTPIYEITFSEERANLLETELSTSTKPHQEYEKGNINKASPSYENMPKPKDDKSNKNNVKIKPSFKHIGWLFLGAYNKNKNKIFSNIEEYPIIGKEYEFIRSNRIYNLRSEPPKSSAIYSIDLNDSKAVIGNITTGEEFIIIEIKEFFVLDSFRIWGKIKKKEKA